MVTVQLRHSGVTVARMPQVVAFDTVGPRGASWH
jgi:hypothetical protein